MPTIDITYLFNKFFSPIKYFIFFVSLVFSNQYDTLSYYEKFNLAVNSYKEGRYFIAENQFKKILINDRDYRDPCAQLMMAKSQYQIGKYENAKRVCKSILTNYSNSPYEVDVYILLGDIALTQEKISQAFKFFLQSRPLIEDFVYKNDIDERIRSCIALGVSDDILERLSFIERDEFNREILNLTKSYNAWTYGNRDDLELIINGIDTFKLPGAYSGIFGSLVDAIKDQQIYHPKTFGVVLPLSGVDKDKGLSYLLGLTAYLTSSSLPNHIRLQVYNSSGSGIKALKIVRGLSQNIDILALLGPMTNEEVLSLSGLEVGLPILVPKTNLSGVAEISENLYFLSPSSEIIAKRTAQIIIKELGLKSIGVLSPGDGKIKSSTDYFLEECFQLGVDPIRIEWYIGKPEDVSRQLTNIRRAAWDLVPEDEPDDLSLNLEIDSLDALFDVDVADFFQLPPSQNEEDEMDAKDSAKVILETIEALYMPIRPDELTYIGTQLPLYNLKTKLFVNENWLDMPLLNQEVIGPHINGMRIISDVNSAIINGKQDSFTNYYSLGKDHILFIYSIIESGIKKRNHFIEKLKNYDSYDGNHTSIRFQGYNNNENGATIIIEYSDNSLKNGIIYDGKTITKIKR